MWDIAGHARHPGQQTECGCSIEHPHHKLPPNDLNLLPNTAQFDFVQVLSFCVASLFSPDPSNNVHLDFHTSRPSHISLKCMTKTYPLAVYTARQASSFPVTPTCWTLLNTSEQIWTPFSQDTTVTSLVRSKGAGKPATETPVTAEEGTNSNGCRGCEIPELERNCSLDGTGLLQKRIWSQDITSVILMWFWCAHRKLEARLLLSGVDITLPLRCFASAWCKD